jgi:hypothetical protein
MLETSWIAVALFSLAFVLYRRSLRRACDDIAGPDDAELDAVIGAIEREP